MRSVFKDPGNLRYNLNTIIPVLVFLTSILSAAVACRNVDSPTAHLLWVAGVAVFSALCASLALLAMTWPVKLLMAKAERLIKFEESRKEKGQMIEMYQLIERLMELAGKDHAAQGSRDEALMAGVEKLDYIIPLGYMSLMVAHEVRNPLSTITGMSELLREKVMDDTQSAYIRSILDAAKKIDSFTNELLDFTDNEIVRGEIDVNSIVDEVATTLMLEFPGVRCEIKKEGNVAYFGDRQKIQQAVHNVMRNAFQYESPASDGFVRVETRANGTIKVRVYNKHSTVAPEDMENIFKPFFTRKKRGRGIGLFVAARNARLHGGDITVESGEEGTTFTIALPKMRG